MYILFLFTGIICMILLILLIPTIPFTPWDFFLFCVYTFIVVLFPLSIYYVTSNKVMKSSFDMFTAAVGFISILFFVFLFIVFFQNE
jgi:hypothetical protein